MNQMITAPRGQLLTTHQLVGLLLFREQGSPISRIAQLVDMSETSVESALADAERGECERIRPVASENVPGYSDRASTRNDNDELFLPRWQRVVLRKLAKRGEITLNEMQAIRASYDDGIGVMIDSLLAALTSARMTLASGRHDGKTVYRLTGEPLDRLRRLIANRWVAN